MASCTVRIFSASSSGISMSKPSSNAITSSTVSSESAPRSSTNDALEVTSPSSTPNCSTIICFTFSSTAAMFLLRMPRFNACAGRGPAGRLLLLFRVLVDVVDRILHGANFLRVFVRNFDAEILFQSHHEFDGIERIRAQVFDKRAARGNFVFIHAQLLGDDLFHFFYSYRISFANGCHGVAPVITNSNHYEFKKRRVCSVIVPVNECKGRTAMPLAAGNAP